MIRRQKTNGDTVKVTFAIADEAALGRVSVVGDFNDWKPGAHTLIKRRNGTRSVAVTLPGTGEYRFRYLGEGGNWFDDPEADLHTHDGGVLKV